jgi:tRNA(Arg) A34 adenosine deaminase TadA
MCLGCAGWSGVSRIVFGAYKEDIEPNPYELKDYHAEEHGKRLITYDRRSISVEGGVLREECAQLLKKYKNWTLEEN